MNPQTVRDGNVLLYQRNGYVRRNWYARFRLPGEKRYIVRCSKTQNFTEAEIWAKEFYDELRFKQKHDLPIYTNSFHAVAKIAEKELAIAIENGRAHGQTLKNFKTVMVRYAFPYLGHRPIDKINREIITEYWEWRRQYWVSGPGVNDMDHRAAVTPTETTLYQEGRAISRVFKCAVSRGWVSERRCPDVFPRAKKKAERRPAFPDPEWGYMTQHLGDYVKAATKDAGYDVKAVTRRRWRLYYLVQIILHTGMRPPEAMNLKWRNVEEFTTLNGVETRAVWVHGKSKKRRIVAQPDTVWMFDNWRELTKFDEDDDFVFGDDEGKPWKQAGWNFRKFLRRYGIDQNQHGDAYTLYSLRHIRRARRWVDDPESGEKVFKEVPVRFRPWWWTDVDGKVFMDVRYGNKRLEIKPKKSAIEVGDQSNILPSLKLLREAVVAGELDKVLMAAKEARRGQLRKKK